MLKRCCALHLLSISLIVICLLSFSSCGRQKLTFIPDQGKTPQKDSPTENVYRKIILHNFDVDNTLSQNHPTIGAFCESATLRELLNIGTAPMIVKTAPKSLREMDTIIVKVRLSSLRESQQIRGKTMASQEKMTAHVRLLDASTGKTIHEKEISLPGRTSGPSDADASELGLMIARHINRIVRSE